jgi:hypothetical protein
MIVLLYMDLFVHYSISCVEVQGLLTLCPATNFCCSCCGETCPYSLASDAGLRPLISWCNDLLSYLSRVLRFDIGVDLVVCLRCISYWICAQHNLIM